MERSRKKQLENLIRADIDYAISLSESYEEFLEQMRSMHYQIREGTSQEEGAILSLKLPGQGKAWRTKKEDIGRSLYGSCDPERLEKNGDHILYLIKVRNCRVARCVLIGKASGESPDIKPVMSGTFTRSRTAMLVEIFYAINQGSMPEIFDTD